MAGSLNKAVELYREGHSLPEVAEMTGRAMSTIRYHVKKAGLLRSRADGVRASAHKISEAQRGVPKPKSSEHRAAISAGRLRWGAANAKGTRKTPHGYIEYTTGPHKGRSVHTVKMKARIGRRICEDECVHHIDGNKTNNCIDNLALMTRAAHMRLHKREEKLTRKVN